MVKREADSACQLTIAGEGVNDRCPDHFHCYVPCTAGQVNTWIAVDGSPYNGKGYCEQFPRADRVQAMPKSWDGTYTYLAMVGMSCCPLDEISLPPA